jgi:hypothetical protein
MKIKRYKKGVMFEFPGAKDVRLWIRPVFFSDSLSLLQEVKEKVVVENAPLDDANPTKRGPRIVDNFDDGAFTWRLFDQALQSWEGIEVEVEEGEPMLGPIEVKRAIFDNEKVREFVFSKSRELAQMEGKQVEEEKKN